MKYMIVAWTDQGWVILHYSHRMDDVKRWYDKYKALYPTCQFMIDYHEATSLESKKTIMDAFNSLLEGLTQ